ncbi:MAG: hypothetical protein ABIF01_04190 [Candidatus Micrarchaeota archaeon]
MGFLRGQGGVEYISNYTIAGVIVLIIIAALIYLGVFNPNQPDVCIFQKGLNCESNYIKQGEDNAKLKIMNQFDDAIVIKGVLCSGEPIDPSSGLPYARTWGDPHSGQALVDGQQVSSSPIVLPSNTFELETYCYTEKSFGLGSLPPSERFKGIVFIRYRLNSSPDLPGGAGFLHVVQGNLQGRLNP